MEPSLLESNIRNYAHIEQLNGFLHILTEINAKEELKLAWPHRITSLENDILVFKHANLEKGAALQKVSKELPI